MTLTPVEIWAPSFLEYKSQPVASLASSPKFKPSWLAKPEHVFFGARCILCEADHVYDRESHLKQHMRELHRYINQKAIKEDKQKPPAVVREPKPEPVAVSPNYDKPCVVCGQPIPRTGKRGRPPAKCANCK